MSPHHQSVINTLAYWTNQMILDHARPDVFLRHLLDLQKDLEGHRRSLTPRQITDDADDEDLTSPLNYDGD